jgi:hypothetical protein
MTGKLLHIAQAFRQDGRREVGPGPHFITAASPFGSSVRRMMAVSASIGIGYAAMDAAIANYPDQRFTLRNGILTLGSIRELSRVHP